MHNDVNVWFIYDKRAEQADATAYALNRLNIKTKFRMNGTQK